MTLRTILPLLVLAVGSAHAETGYHLAKTVAVPGTGTYYDFLRVDPAARRLYVSFGGEVAVLDADTQAIVGKLAGGKKVHGMAVASGRVFVSDGGTDSVRVYDARTLAQLGEVKTGKNPDDIIYDPGSKQVVAFNHSDGTVTLIDPMAMKATGSIDVPGKLELGRADGKGTVWVNVEDKHEVARLDTRKKTVTAHWSLAPCQEPTGLAFDAKTRRLFAGCNNNLMAVMNADTGKVVATVPIGGDVDGTEFDPATRTIFVSCGGDQGTLAVIHQDGADRYALVKNVVTRPRAKTLALDPRTHRVFLTAPLFGPAPAATAQTPAPKGPILPGTFSVLVVDP